MTPRTLGLADRRWLEADIVVWAAGVNGPGFVGGLDGFGVTRRATSGRSALQTLADKRMSALGDGAMFDASTAGRPLLLPRVGRTPAGAIFCQTAPACHRTSCADLPLPESLAPDFACRI